MQLHAPLQGPIRKALKPGPPVCVCATGSGALERSELAALLRDFLGAGKVTSADVSYFE